MALPFTYSLGVREYLLHKPHPKTTGERGNASWLMVSTVPALPSHHHRHSSAHPYHPKSAQTPKGSARCFPGDTKVPLRGSVTNPYATWHMEPGSHHKTWGVHPSGIPETSCFVGFPVFPFV